MKRVLHAFALLLLPVISEASQEVFFGEIASVSHSTFTAGVSTVVTVQIRSTGGSGNVYIEADSWTSGWSVTPPNYNPTITQGIYYNYYFTVTPPSNGGNGMIVWKLYDDDYGIHPSGSILLATRNQAVSAATPSYTVGASAGTGGTVTPSSRTVSSNSTTTFTVSPSSGYVRGSVSGDAAGGS